jgi:plasmid maintenance system killer protein
MIASWRHKGLRDLFLTGASAKVRADQQKKCLRLLDALDQAALPEDMNLPLDLCRAKPWMLTSSSIIRERTESR